MQACQCPSTLQVKRTLGIRWRESIPQIHSLVNTVGIQAETKRLRTGMSQPFVTCSTNPLMVPLRESWCGSHHQICPNFQKTLNIENRHKRKAPDPQVSRKKPKKATEPNPRTPQPLDSPKPPKPGLTSPLGGLPHRMRGWRRLSPQVGAFGSRMRDPNRFECLCVCVSVLLGSQKESHHWGEMVFASHDRTSGKALALCAVKAVDGLLLVAAV